LSGAEGAAFKASLTNTRPEFSPGGLQNAIRTPEQTEIGLFWTDHVGSQYSRAFRVLAIARDLGISDTARLFATMFTTGADALIGCWDAKYQYSFWRPVTAIPTEISMEIRTRSRIHRGCPEA
jgi:hypothetical protein